MKDLPNNLKSEKTSAKAIAECISDELGIEIDLNYYRKFIALIKKRFKHYEGLRMGSGAGFPLAREIKILDNVIKALEVARDMYIILPNYGPDGLVDLHEKSFHGEDIYLIPGEYRDQKTRRTKIKSVTKDLGKIKNKLLGVVDSKFPMAMLSRKYPKDWLIWVLFRHLRSGFSGHVLHDTKIDRTIYRLLRLHGAQEEESDNPARMIRRRRKSFSGKIEPHLSPPE